MLVFSLRSEERLCRNVELDTKRRVGFGIARLLHLPSPEEWRSWVFGLQDLPHLSWPDLTRSPGRPRPTKMVGRSPRRVASARGALDIRPSPRTADEIRRAVGQAGSTPRF